MTNNSFIQRYDCVRHYLNSNDSLRKTAQKFKVHYRSIYQWVKWYQDHGVVRLCMQYKRPWNRTPKGLEKKVVQLKEEMPQLTLNKAQALLKKAGHSLSIKGIWGIWKRYGYCGFRKKQMTAQFTQFGASTAEARAALTQAKELCQRDKIEKACILLNEVPFLPRNEIIAKLPDELLNTRRRVEKLSHLYGTMELQPYLKTTKAMFEQLKRKRFKYSAVRCGIMNVVASSWSIEPRRELTTIRQLKRMLKRKDGCFSPHLSLMRFFILITEGIAWIALKDRKKAKRIARECQKLLKQRHIVSPSFFNYLGILYTYLEEYRAAALLVAESYSRAGEERKKFVAVDMIKEFIRGGDYDQAEKLMKQWRFIEAWGGMSGELRCRAILSLVRGMPHEAIDYAMQSLSLAQKGELTLYIYHTYFLIASAYGSIGETTRAVEILERLIPYLKKQRLHNDMLLIQTILQSPSKKERQMLRDPHIFPRFRLMLLLKYGYFRKASQLAGEKGMLSYFHRYMFFFPTQISEQTRDLRGINIPDDILQLPVFNSKRSVYTINFLGEVQVLKDQEPLPVVLFPKDTAFLIHCACRIPEPGIKIPLQDIYHNFWPRSAHPSRNLSHMLVRIRKQLRMSKEVLAISHRTGESVLINRGIHFATDYGHLQETLMRIQALKRAGEWRLVEEDYLHMIPLVRGEFFVRMYDVWSEEVRESVLNTIDNELHQIQQEAEHYQKYDVLFRLFKKIHHDTCTLSTDGPEVG